MFIILGALSAFSSDQMRNISEEEEKLRVIEEARIAEEEAWKNKPAVEKIMEICSVTEEQAAEIEAVILNSLPLTTLSFTRISASRRESTISSLKEVASI